jgi:hypothetical protein
MKFHSGALPGPDLAQGITMDDLVDDKLVGHVGSEEV